MSNVVTITQKKRRIFTLDGIDLAEAKDAFAACDVHVSEEFGVVKVVDTSLSTVRAKLREAGFRTKMAT